MSEYSELKKLVESMEEDYSKFIDKGVKSAATRYRVKLLALKKMCDTIRREVLATSKEMDAKRKEALPKPKPKTISKTTRKPTQGAVPKVITKSK